MPFDGAVDRGESALIVRDVRAYRLTVRFADLGLSTGPNISDESFSLVAAALSIDGIRTTVGQVVSSVFTGQVTRVTLTIDGEQYGRVVSADFRKC